MDQHAATRAGEPDAAEMAETVSARAAEDAQARREGGSPHLTLDGFSGPLETLLTLARAQRIDLFRISLTALLDQLTAALWQASKSVPLGQQGAWVVMAAWLVQLRTRLLLPADAPAQQEAVDEADAFRTRLALFDDETAVGTTEIYRARPFELYKVAEARDRILRLLANTPRRGAAGAVPADGTGKRRQRLRSGAAAALGLVQHAHRWFGIGQTRRCGAGAGQGFRAHPRGPGLSPPVPDRAGLSRPDLSCCEARCARCRRRHKRGRPHACHRQPRHRVEPRQCTKSVDSLSAGW